MPLLLSGRRLRSGVVPAHDSVVATRHALSVLAYCPLRIWAGDETDLSPADTLKNYLIGLTYAGQFPCATVTTLLTHV